MLRFVHFTDNNRNGVDRKDDRLWKIRDLFEILRTNLSTFYTPSEHLAVDSHCEIQGMGSFQAIHSEKKTHTKVTASKCSNYATLLDTYLT